MKGARLFALVATVLVTASARAQGLPESDAERLTKEGQDLLERGQVVEACSKFDLSLKREDNVNTLALLAFCHERAGKPGRAWNEFRRVEPRVPPGEKAVFVAQHLRGLETKVARARLDVGNRTITEVRVDNDVVMLEAGRIVADPGDHTVHVEAGGRSLSRNATLVLGENPDIVMTDAAPPPPAIAPDGPSVATPPIDGVAADDGSGQRTAGLVFGAVGVAFLGVAVYEGITTIQIKKDADATCGGDPPSCAGSAAATRASERRNDAIVPSWIATGGAVLGAASLGLGIYLFAGAPSSATSPATITTGGVRWTPLLGPSSAGLRGVF